MRLAKYQGSLITVLGVAFILLFLKSVGSVLGPYIADTKSVDQVVLNCFHRAIHWYCGIEHKKRLDVKEYLIEILHPAKLEITCDITKDGENE